LEVNDALVVLDREQGATSNLLAGGVNVHVLITLSQLLQILLNRKLITEQVNIIIIKNKKPFIIISLIV